MLIEIDYLLLRMEFENRRNNNHFTDIARDHLSTYLPSLSVAWISILADLHSNMTQQKSNDKTDGGHDHTL